MILTILTFIVILSFLVFIHELGHFLVAKKFGMGVEEFGFGLPPRIWGKKVGETIYSINALPIGGFVRLTGEDQIENQSKPPKDKAELKKYFWARPKRERIAVLLAGVTMNFVLAIIVISYIFTQGVFIPTERVHIEKVSEDSPAVTAGFIEKDVIISFADEEIKKTEDLINIAKTKGGETVSVVVKRGSEQLTLYITPRKDPPEGQGPLGIVISNLEEKKYPWYQAPFFGTIEALKLSYLMISSLVVLLFKLITFQPTEVEVAGPIGIAQVTGQAVKQGYMAVLQLTGLLSLNLAIFNVLPIPALDGGRLFFVIFERWLGRHVKPKVEAAIHQVGMVFLLALFVLVTLNDLRKLFKF